jgi:RNA polymerase sigma factor (sigma-70 family)
MPYPTFQPPADFNPATAPSDSVVRASQQLMLSYARERSQSGLAPQDELQELALWTLAKAYFVWRPGSLTFRQYALFTLSWTITRHLNRQAMLRKRRSAREQDPKLEELDAGIDVEQQVMDGLLHAEVRHAMAGLSPRDRHVLEAIYLDGRLFCEVAAEMGVSCSRITQIHRRALARVRQRLDVVVPKTRKAGIVHMAS